MLYAYTKFYSMMIFYQTIFSRSNKPKHEPSLHSSVLWWWVGLAQCHHDSFDQIYLKKHWFFAIFPEGSRTGDGVWPKQAFGFEQGFLRTHVVATIYLFVLHTHVIFKVLAVLCPIIFWSRACQMNHFRKDSASIHFLSLMEGTTYMDGRNMFSDMRSP